MDVYDSDFLTIRYIKEQGLLRQEWKNRSLTNETFQREMLYFKEALQNLTPKKVLWLQENFNFQVPSQLHQWIEKNINKEGKRLGVKMTAFTTSDNFLIQYSVKESFDKPISIVKPYFFPNEKAALSWLEQGTDQPTTSIGQWRLKVGSQDKYTNLISIQQPKADLAKFASMLTRIQEEEALVKAYQQKFKSLSLREKEVLRLIVLGLESKAMASELSLSLHTVNTHRKNLSAKLGVQAPVQLVKLAFAFGLI